MRPGTFFIEGGRVPTSSAGPITTTFSKTSGGELDLDRRRRGIKLNAELGFQVHDAFVAKGPDGQARLGVERHELKARRDGEHALVRAVRSARPGYLYRRGRSRALGQWRARSPSSRCHAHLVAPVVASAATTHHRVAPAVKYSVLFTMIGVLSLRYSAGMLKLSDFHRQATRRVATLSRVI